MHALKSSPNCFFSCSLSLLVFTSRNVALLCRNDFPTHDDDVAICLCRNPGICKRSHLHTSRFKCSWAKKKQQMPINNNLYPGRLLWHRISEEHKALCLWSQNEHESHALLHIVYEKYALHWNAQRHVNVWELRPSDCFCCWQRMFARFIPNAKGTNQRFIPIVIILAFFVVV